MLPRVKTTDEAAKVLALRVGAIHMALIALTRAASPEARHEVTNALSEGLTRAEEYFPGASMANACQELLVLLGLEPKPSRP